MKNNRRFFLKSQVVLGLGTLAGTIGSSNLLAATHKNQEGSQQAHQMPCVKLIWNVLASPFQILPPRIHKQDRRYKRMITAWHHVKENFNKHLH